MLLLYKNQISQQASSFCDFQGIEDTKQTLFNLMTNVSICVKPQLLLLWGVTHTHTS